MRSVRPSFNASGGFSIVDGVTKVSNAIFGKAGSEAFGRCSVI